MDSIFYVLKPDGLLLFSLMRKVNKKNQEKNKLEGIPLQSYLT